MSADERRKAVVAAAMHEFARGGLAGTSTEAIAARAGISQPYLFRLFSTKRELFVAAVGRGFDLAEQELVSAAEGLAGEAALESISRGYARMLEDREALLLQLQSYAAAAAGFDTEVAEHVRERFGRLVGVVADIAGLDSEQLRRVLALGTLCSVVAALDLQGLGPGLTLDALLGLVRGRIGG